MQTRERETTHTPLPRLAGAAAKVLCNIFFTRSFYPLSSSPKGSSKSKRSTQLGRHHKDHHLEEVRGGGMDTLNNPKHPLFTNTLSLTPPCTPVTICGQVLAYSMGGINRTEFHDGHGRVPESGVLARMFPVVALGLSLPGRHCNILQHPAAAQLPLLLTFPPPFFPIESPHCLSCSCS